MLELNSAIGSKTGWLSVGGANTDYNENTLVGKNVVIVGYPKATNHYMYRDKKPIIAFPEGYLISTRADGTEGQEGGPMLISAGGEYYAIGIYTNCGTSTVNYGRYITKKVAELIDKY